MASAGPRQVATVRPTLQVSVGSFRVGCHADFGIDRQLSRSGPSSLRKVTFGVGLEVPKSDLNFSTTLVIVMVSNRAISDAVAAFMVDSPMES